MSALRVFGCRLVIATVIVRDTVSITCSSPWEDGGLKIYHGGRLGGKDDGIMIGDRRRAERTPVKVWDSERIARVGPALP
jgi:hypothetical protein